MKAQFHDHSVAPEGLYIRGLVGRSMTPDVEIFVDRTDAEQFGWIDPLDGEPEEGTEAEAQRLRNTLHHAIEDLSIVVSAHNLDMTQRAFEKVQDILATLKRSVAPKTSEKPVDPEREQALKKLAEWNAMSQRG